MADNTTHKYMDLAFNDDDVFDVGYKFDRDELDLYETKSIDEMINEYIELLHLRNKEATIRAYIIRSFIFLNGYDDDINKVKMIEYELSYNDNNAYDTINAIMDYYEFYDEYEDGWPFHTHRVIKGFWGEDD